RPSYAVSYARFQRNLDGFRASRWKPADCNPRDFAVRRCHLLTAAKLESAPPPQPSPRHSENRGAEWLDPFRVRGQSSFSDFLRSWLGRFVFLFCIRRVG